MEVFDFHRVQIFLQLAGLNVGCRGVYCQMQISQNIKYILAVDGSAQHHKTRSQGDRLFPLRETPDIRCIVAGLYMPAGSGDGHAVKHLQEIEIQL